jgi:predicted GNAT family acetyltransferase
MHDVNQLSVINNEEKSRYEIKLNDHWAYVDYRSRGDFFELMYIFVPVPFRGKGISEKLIKHVLDEQLAKNRKIKVYCSWIAGYIRSHPQYHALLTST